VMIDDLVTRGVSEPYRMFTSRAEFRLTLRADNADQRLTQRGIDLGLVDSGRAAAFHVKQSALDAARAQAATLILTPAEAIRAGLKVNADGVRRDLTQLLTYPSIGWSDLEAIWPQIAAWAPAAREQIEVDAAYSGYLDRQTAEVEAFRRDEGLSLPADLDYAAIPGLSNEARQKLTAVRPQTLGQASRIEGMTPGAITSLLGHVRRASKAA
jgi:tRNA uridine 5-carboxymethylaminomethyl modification enzyme